MRFPYLPWIASQPVYPLGGAKIRHYPVFNVRLGNSAGWFAMDSLLDSGADDTIFPATAAKRAGVDLSKAPIGYGQAVGGAILPCYFAAVTLRISDGRETCEWQALVGFINAPMRWPLLGQTGFLQFFDVLLYGARREVVLTPNAAFAGAHTVP